MCILIVLGLFVAVSAMGDFRCDNIGGTCLDFRYHQCTSGYKIGLCSGDSNRRCCMGCDEDCMNKEKFYSNIGYDAKCTSDGGECKHNSNYCAGYYESGKCGGPTERQCCISNSLGSGSFGNISEVDTTGASCATARQDRLEYCGVKASRRMAKTDEKKMANYKGLIVKAAKDLGMDASVIAGIISRETRAGSGLRSDGFGADGHGYGLMQVDNRYHELRGGPYSLEHIKQGTKILIGMIEGVKHNHPTWTQNMLLKGGISAYNAGVNNVRTYKGMDIGTTGNDYANDVVARSQYYTDNGY